MKTPTQISQNVKEKQEWSAPQLELIYIDQTNYGAGPSTIEDTSNYSSV